MRATSLVLLLAAVSGALGVTVNVENVGVINGTESKTAWTQRTVYEYRGVPYAESPDGDLKFKLPVPKAPWEGTFNAEEYGPACPQPSAAALKAFAADVPQPDRWVRKSQLKRSPDVSKAIVGNIDCLTMDIYTPTTNASAMLPVFVYIHGGAFMEGQSSAQRPDYLLEKDIVLVVPQYRLGPLGFFYMNTEEAPGNMGLYDQELALKWVRNNIGTFGGNPALVTVGGHSAGGASASLHLINHNYNETHRLLDRVIATGGSALSLWASVSAEQGHAGSMDVAQRAGCTGLDPNALVTCMRALDLDILYGAFLQHQTEEMKKGYMGMGSSIPVVQTNLPEGITPFLAESPQVTLENGTYYVGLPLLAGVANNEGIYSLDVVYQFNLKPNDLLENQLYLKNELIAGILNSYGVNENSRVMADACARRYFEPDELGNFEDMTLGLVDFCGVTYVTGSVFRQTELHSLKMKSYLYNFEYQGEHSMISHSENSVPIHTGVTHGDDMLYIFPHDTMPMTRSSDVTMVNRMIDLYTNFIIHGDPTPGEHSEMPEFISYHRDEGNYMAVDEPMVMRGMFRETFISAHRDGLGQMSGAAHLGASLLLLGATIVALFH